MLTNRDKHPARDEVAAPCDAVSGADRPLEAVGGASILPRAAVDQQTWRGASGVAYRHVVTSLIATPLTGAATYVLARRSPRGDLTVLTVGQTEHEAPTLNRAHLRREGATLGANEVHLYCGAAEHHERQRVVADLSAALGLAPDGIAREGDARPGAAEAVVSHARQSA